MVEVEEPGHENVVFKDRTCRGAFAEIVAAIEKLRVSSDTTKLFPGYITGHDLFGFTEPNIVKVIEIIQSIESDQSNKWIYVFIWQEYTEVIFVTDLTWWIFLPFGHS